MKTLKPTQARFPLGWHLAISSTSLMLVIAFSSAPGHANGAKGNGAVKIDFVAEEALVPIGPPGKIWVSDGEQHIRDLR